MAQITLVIPASANVTGVTLLSLADATTNAAVPLPGTVAFAGPTPVAGGNQWVRTFAAPSSVRVRYSVAVLPSGQVVPGGTVAGDGAAPVAATGQFTDQDSLGFFVGPTVLARLSQHKPESTNNNVPPLPISVPMAQQAISFGDAKIVGHLGRVSVFAQPLRVGGVLPRLAPASVAGPLLMAVANKYAGWLLVEGMRTASLRGDKGLAAIIADAAAWKGEADADLDAIVSWARGGLDGLYVDLDLVAGASIPPAPGTVSAAPSVVMAPQCGPYGYSGRGRWC